MPIRHPLGMSTPASSASSRIGRVAGRLDGRAVLGEADRAALADDRGRDAELLGEQLHPALLVVALESVEQPGRTAGERGALLQVGHEVVEVGHVEHAVLVVVARDEVDHPGLVELAQVVMKIECGSLGATCTTVMS